MIILSVPLTSLVAIHPLLVKVPEVVPVIDTGNYHPCHDGRITALEDGQVEASRSAQQLDRPVTKAWNAVLALTIAEKGTPPGSPGRIALPVCGDDPDAQQVAATLTGTCGSDPVDIGGLENRRRAQPANPVYCTELPREALREAVDRAEARPAPTRRDLSSRALQTFGDDLSREDIVRLHRAITRTPDPL